MNFPIILRYTFNSMIFEFLANGEIIITDERYRRKYRLTIELDPELPFVIQLLEILK